MAEDKIVVRGADFEVEAGNRGKQVLSLSVAGKVRLKLGQMICGKFAPSATMGVKMRCHRSEDALEAALETESVIPFGCEYLIGNKIVVADGVLDVTGSIRPLNSGAVGDLDIGDIEFPGSVTHVEMTLVDGKTKSFSGGKFGELYCAEEPPLSLKLTFDDGVVCEYCTGFDWWRHCAAKNIAEAKAEFSILWNSDGVSFSRRVFIYDPEAETIEKRPWKFNTLFAWMAPGAEREKLPESALEKIDGCPLSGAFRRELRRRVRKSENDFILSADIGLVCDDAAHLDRKNQVSIRHYDPAEYLADYLWANHLLDRRGNFFAIAPAKKKSEFLLLAKCLEKRPRKLIGDDEEK